MRGREIEEEEDEDRVYFLISIKGRRDGVTRNRKRSSYAGDDTYFVVIWDY